MNKKILLMILDGWGKGRTDRSNAIYTAGAPYLDALSAKYPSGELLTCGEDVGLPAGQMGNSEVGHLNIGAGRVVYQDLVRINHACADKSLANNKELVAAFTNAGRHGKRIHLMGLVSDGGVHSSMEHLFALCQIADKYVHNRDVYVHCFMDGRDTDPHSGLNFIAALKEHIRRNTINTAIATIIGRYYAMDRDKRWDRIKIAYDLLVHGKGRPVHDDDPIIAMQTAYENGESDEFIKPVMLCPLGTIKAGDSVVFFNFRNDRAKELTIALTQQDMPEHGMTAMPLHYCTMTPYDDKFKGLHVLFDKENVQNTIGEVLSKHGKRQLRIAETEKYAHVTFFLSGGREEPFAGEERILIPSPKVATYDLQPEMSAVEVKDAIVKELNTKKYDFIALNFANGDMVGHTGVYDAICRAVRTIDGCVGEIVPAAAANGYTTIIIADHGNADYAVNEDGTPNTAHSLNPVPMIVVDDDVKIVENGVLADVAPTVLSLMGIGIPQDMTGRILTKM
jgi:2,3-bisphosphoglycerate-independent phosphoglycerate mutase